MVDKRISVITRLAHDHNEFIKGLFTKVGKNLHYDISALGIASAYSNYSMVKRTLNLEAFAFHMRDIWQISNRDLVSWISDLETRSDEGRFFFSVSTVLVRGWMQ